MCQSNSIKYFAIVYSRFLMCFYFDVFLTMRAKQNTFVLTTGIFRQSFQINCLVICWHVNKHTKKIVSEKKNVLYSFIKYQL